MAWQRWIGYDDGLLERGDAPEESGRQRFVFSMLSALILTLSVLCGTAAVVYTLIIFHNWPVAVVVGVFMGLIVFNMYGLIVITAFSAYGTALAEYFNDHTRYYREHVQPDEDLKGRSAAWIDEKVAEARKRLSEEPAFETARKPMSFPEVFTMTLRVAFLSILAILFSTGIEIVLFRSQINDSLASLYRLYTDIGDAWMVQNVLTPAQGDAFYVINANSLLLVVEVLNAGLGGWKIVLDLLFLTLFLSPLVVVFRSREFREGAYIRAYVISCLSISFRHYLISKRGCQVIRGAFEAEKGILSPRATEPETAEG